MLDHLVYHILQLGLGGVLAEGAHHGRQLLDQQMRTTNKTKNSKHKALLLCHLSSDGSVAILVEQGKCLAVFRDLRHRSEPPETAFPHSNKNLQKIFNENCLFCGELVFGSHLAGYNL